MRCNSGKLFCIQRHRVGRGKQEQADGMSSSRGTWIRFRKSGDWSPQEQFLAVLPTEGRGSAARSGWPSREVKLNAYKRCCSRHPTSRPFRAGKPSDLGVSRHSSFLRAPMLEQWDTVSMQPDLSYRKPADVSVQQILTSIILPGLRVFLWSCLL